MIWVSLLMQLLGMGVIGSFLLATAWMRLTADRLFHSHPAGWSWRFDKPLLICIGVTLLTLGTMTMCYNRAIVVWVDRAPPPGVFVLQLAAMVALVAGIMTLLWVAGIGRRIWAFILFWMFSSAWAAVVIFWTLGYIGHP